MSVNTTSAPSATDDLMLGISGWIMLNLVNYAGNQDIRHIVLGKTVKDRDSFMDMVRVRVRPKKMN